MKSRVGLYGFYVQYSTDIFRFNMVALVRFAIFECSSGGYCGFFSLALPLKRKGMVLLADRHGQSSGYISMYVPFILHHGNNK